VATVHICQMTDLSAMSNFSFLGGASRVVTSRRLLPNWTWYMEDTRRCRLLIAGLCRPRGHEAFLSRRDFMSVAWQFTAWNDAKEKAVS
jgi:hypothetical protein